MNVVALLDSMWGWGGWNEPGEQAPRHFRINSDNFSGRRLYRLVGVHSLLVTNCCRYVVSHANEHGMPDLDWVRENLAYLKHDKLMDLLLVCGKVSAKVIQTLSQSPRAMHPGVTSGRMELRGVGWATFICIDHPAARRWSNAKLDATTKEIDSCLRTYNQG